MAAGETRESDEQRIARWVRVHAAAVRGYLLGMIRRPDVADDLVQEVFQRAWQARERYLEQGRERAYLLRIADRLVVDRSRRLPAEVNLDGAAWQAVEPAAESSGPVEELTSSEADESLSAALDRLTPVQRRVLLLRYFGDLTFEEIAAAIDCPLSTALSHCRRGLIALRKLMTVNTNP